jgi:MFS family permease
VADSDYRFNTDPDPDGQPPVPRADKLTDAVSRETVVTGGGGGFSLSNLKTFRSFRHRAFRFYYGALLGQTTALNIQMVVRSLLIYRLTDSAAILGMMSLATALPMLLFSAFGGTLADRFSKKYVLMIGQALAALVALGVALALEFGFLAVGNDGSWWILIVASVIQGTIVAFTIPAQQALVAQVVVEKEIMNAVALNNMGMNAVRLLAPAIAGFFIEGLGFELIYYTMVGTYILTILLLMPLKLRPVAHQETFSMLQSLRDGARYIWGHVPVRTVLSVTLLAFILGTPYIFLMPIFADDVLGVGASGMGLLLSASGGGAILGSLIMASLPERKRGLILLGSMVCWAVTLGVFAFSRSLPLSLTMMALVGVTQTAFITSSNSLLLRHTHEDYYGRVMSIFMMQFGVTSLGASLAGLLSESIGISWTIGGFMALMLAFSVLLLVLLPRLRSLD